jgi:DNA-binding MarR family transcriptional regulator
MNSKKDLERQVFHAAQGQGISAVLFRNAIGRKMGLNVTDGECLSFLSIKGTSSPKEVAHYTGLTTGATTAMLDRLEKAGFIRRTLNPHDRRGVLIDIDDHWKKTAGPLVTGVQEAHQRLIKSYSEQELETIVDFLARFTKNVQNHIEHLEK